MKHKIFILPIIILSMILLGVFYVSALTHITNCTQLQDMNNNLTENYVLDNNIDCSDTINWNGGEGFIPVGTVLFVSEFQGSFDGQGHNILNFYINRTGESGIGLFGFASNSIIKNVNLININISASNVIGGLIGGSHSNIIDNCSVTGNILETGVYSFLYGGATGGLIGGSNQDNITNCYANINIMIENNGYSIGGLIGLMNDGYINNSYAIGNINNPVIDVGTIGEVGGLVGFFQGAVSNTIDIENSYAIENIACSDLECGGLIGSTGFSTNFFNIRNCFAISNITSITDQVGGLIGHITSYSIGSNITNSFSSGSINGNDYVGGLIGYIEESDLTITNSYSLASVTGIGANLGGLTGSGTATCTNSYWNQNFSGQLISSCGTELNYSDLLLQTSYSGWDFLNEWNIVDSSSTPCLRFNCIYPFSIFVPIVSQSSSITGNAVYQIMNTSGAGLGIFIQLLAQALPLLLIGLAFVGIFIAIGLAIKKYLIEGGSP